MNQDELIENQDQFLKEDIHKYETDKEKREKNRLKFMSSFK